MSLATVRRRRLHSLLAFVLLGACHHLPSRPAALSNAASPPTPRLRELGTIVVAVPRDARTLLVVGRNANAAGPNGGTSNPTGREEFALRGAEHLRTTLQQLGFRIAADTGSADAIVEFTCGNLLFSADHGWQAADAHLVFRRARTAEFLAAFSASTTVATASVDSLVSKITRAVKNQY